MVKAQDQDINLKLRFRRILFAQGYWSPIEIELSQFENLGSSLKRSPITDLDVLGIKYDGLFTSSKVVGDCKSGKNVSDVNRLFWLKGVKDYFGADQAYLLHPFVDAHARAIAPKLGLRVMDNQTLDELERKFNLAEFPIPLADEKIQSAIENNWGINVLKGKKPTEEQLQVKDVYSHLSYRYWYIDQNRNLMSVIANFTRVAHLLRSDDKRHVLLAHIGLERFVHSLLEAISYILSQGTSNIQRDFRYYLYGGPINLREKEQFFTLLRKVTKANEQLDPPYFPEVLEFVGRIIRNPDGGKDILRHLQAAYIWCTYLDNKTLPPLDGREENTAAIVLSRDAAKIFSSVTGLKKSLFASIDAL